MATYTQSSNNVSSSYYNFFLSKVPYGSDYIIFATDDYYYCIYGDHAGGTTFTDTIVISISRSYGSQGQVNYSSESSSTVNINYEYYSYSNVGTGTLIDFPIQDQLVLKHESFQTSLLLAILLCFIGFNVIRNRWKYL